jgi:hypothetical protein
VVCKFVVMSKLCERPGCSNPGEAAYGMVAEDLLFWIEPLDRHPIGTANVLCRRHADAMSVPRGWTLDDRRQAGGPRLFQPQRFAPPEPAGVVSRRSRSGGATGQRGEQLQIDGTGEIPRPELPPDGQPSDELIVESPSDEAPWVPAFDTDDDLGGLLKVSSPLLSRAFRGDQRRR